MSSPFRKTSAAKGAVAARKQEYLDSIGPDGNNYHKAKTRKNAYVTLKCGNSTLPLEENTYDALYSNEEGKPDAILLGVSISEGSDLGMLRTVEAEFECLSRATFDALEPDFLAPGNKEAGRTLSVKYGYSDGKGSSGSEDDFIICKYAFELTEKNTYKCSFKAYGPGPFLNNIQAGAAGSYKKLSIVTGGFFKSPVVTLPQYLKWCAQDGGIMANVDIANWSKPAAGGKKVIVVDNPNAITPTGMIMPLIYKALQAIGIISSDSSKKIYCTLQWFVETLNTFHIQPKLGKSMKGRSLNCNNQWIQKGAHTVSEVGSAYPMSIVLPGAGYYGSSPKITDKECKLDFDTNNCGKATNGDYRNILLSYDYIASKVFGMSKEKGAVKANDKADKTANKDVPPDVTVNTIMKTVFNDIYHATGGLVHLALQEDPGDGNILNVIPKNSKASGYEATPFDPINGDGITRKCTVKCDVPANDAYAVANGNKGGGGGSGMVSSLMGGDSATEAKKKGEDDPLTTAKKNVKELMEVGLSANEFDSEDCDALQAAFKDLIDNQPPSTMKNQSFDKNVWPLNLEIEIDGTHGFKFGDVVSSTFMPEKYRDTKIEFVVTEATHEISNNDWVTKLKTQCFLGGGN